MFNRRKPSPAELRNAERRQREDAATRLRAEVPTLLTLELAISESRSGSVLAETRHVRRVVVERAPGHFELPCTDRSCSEGGHDLTREIMASLRGNQRRFEGGHHCDGNVGSGACNRELRYVAVATYSE